jgi:hypothetical protein
LRDCAVADDDGHVLPPSEFVAAGDADFAARAPFHRVLPFADQECGESDGCCFPPPDLVRISASSSVLKLACISTIRSARPISKDTFWATFDTKAQLDIVMLVAVMRLLRAYGGHLGSSKQLGSVIQTRDQKERWIADLTPSEEQQLMIW